MIVFPHAKVNLGLHVLRKRPDGYHDLETCFHPLGWSDMLEIVEAEPGQPTAFRATGRPVPGPEGENLCLKAYELLREGFDLPPVLVHLHKILPIGAGLGGGSADGAFALKLLDGLFSLGLSAEELRGFAARLGSDCPFFVEGAPVFAEGTGGEFSAIEIDLSGWFLLAVWPGVHVSTGEAYRGVRPGSPAVPLREALARPVAEWREALTNDFEESVFAQRPEIGELKESLYRQGAAYAAMSGSGSACFGLFETLPEIDFPEGHEAWVERL